MTKAHKITSTALLFAVAVILSWLESLVPMPSFLAGVKLGLSNIAVMYCLFYMGKQSAFLLAVLKSLFALLTRGVMSGIMSLCGGIVSILAMTVVLYLFKDNISLMMTSVIGGVLHNTAQLITASLITNNIYTMYYFPVLLLSGTVAGILTGTVLKTVMPALKRVNLSNKNTNRKDDEIEN